MYSYSYYHPSSRKTYDILFRKCDAECPAEQM